MSVTEAMQSAQLPAVKEIRPEYRDIHSQVLQDVLTRLDRAFEALFRRKREGQTPGYPRFQGSSRYNSFTYKQFGNGATLDGGTNNGFLILSKIGRIALHWSRPLEGAPKTVTVSREADGWYVCFSCADVPMQPLPVTGQETGIDVGIEAFATLSNGTRISSPGWYRKAVTLLAKPHQKVRRQRQDFHHKTALALVRVHDTIYHEDLRTANMVKNHHVGEKHHGCGVGRFLIILAYKAAYAGRRIIAVNPPFTSQTCGGCGLLVQKGLSVRWRSCPDCVLALHRDHNAARNIERAGQALRRAVA